MPLIQIDINRHWGILASTKSCPISFEEARVWVKFGPKRQILERFDLPQKPAKLTASITESPKEWVAQLAAVQQTAVYCPRDIRYVS